MTSKPYIYSSTKSSGLTLTGIEQLKHIIPFKAPWPCSLPALDSLGFSGQVSSPIPSLGQGGTFLSCRFTSRHLRKVTFAPSSCGQRLQQHGHIWAPSPGSFILRQPGQTWSSICLAPLPGIQSNQTLEHVQLMNDRTLRKRKNTRLSAVSCKVHFLGVFGQQCQCLQFPQMGTLTRLWKIRFF